MAKHKTYSRICFSHKKGAWGGMHEGVGLLHRGDTVPFCLNTRFDDQVFETRDGQISVESAELKIFSGQRLLGNVVLAAGTSIFVNENTPALS